jgi:quercetin dioxygenase-like cupin family protein
LSESRKGGREKMKIYKMGEYAGLDIPNADTYYNQKILTDANQAKHLGGIFCQLLPGGKQAYHYHKNRESIIIVISGEATETVENKEINITCGDVLYIPAGEKHKMTNDGKKAIRYLEFYTPSATDRVVVE